MNFTALEEKIKAGYRVGYEEALALSETPQKESLYRLADNLRKHYKQDVIDTCSIMNARSGRCSEDCKWCSQSKFHRTDIEVYPLVSAEKALVMAAHNAKKRVGRFSLVTSGRAMTDSEMDDVCAIYTALRGNVEIKLCASMGLLGREQLRRLKACGIGHYHCNIETAPSYFPKVCTTHTMEEKIQTIRWAKEVGLKICSGGIIGMGETMAQRIEMALTLRELGVDSIPMNILNPIKGTALENAAPLSDEEVLTTFALFRLIHPDTNIRFAGGRLQIAHIEEKALRSGINAALVGDLLTTVGSNIDQDKEMFRRCGYLVE